MEVSFSYYLLEIATPPPYKPPALVRKDSAKQLDLVSGRLEDDHSLQFNWLMFTPFNMTSNSVRLFIC